MHCYHRSLLLHRPLKIIRGVITPEQIILPFLQVEGTMKLSSQKRVYSPSRGSLLTPPSDHHHQQPLRKIITQPITCPQPPLPKFSNTNVSNKPIRLNYLNPAIIPPREQPPPIHNQVTSTHLPTALNIPQGQSRVLAVKVVCIRLLWQSTCFVNRVHRFPRWKEEL